MSTYKAPKRMNRRNELREDKVITFYARFLEFFEENRNVFYMAIGGIVLLIIMGFGYDFFKDQQESQGQNELAGAVRLYESDQWREALDGNEEITGLLEVADKYSGTKAGNLAAYYTADAFYQLGDFENGLKYFQKYNHSEDALGAGAYAGEAAIFEDMDDFAKAADRYKKAALIFESEFTSARYLYNAGRNYELAGDFKGAKDVYEMIRERFPDSEHAKDVDLFLARVNVLESN